MIPSIIHPDLILFNIVCVVQNEARSWQYICLIAPEILICWKALHAKNGKVSWINLFHRVFYIFGFRFFYEKEGSPYLQQEHKIIGNIAEGYKNFSTSLL